MLSPMGYLECESCGKVKSMCECIHEEVNKQQTKV